MPDIVSKISVYVVKNFIQLLYLLPNFELYEETF